MLNEKQRRLYAGLESLKLGHGGDAHIAGLFGIDPHTVARLLKQMDYSLRVNIKSLESGRSKPPQQRLTRMRPPEQRENGEWLGFGRTVDVFLRSILAPEKASRHKTAPRRSGMRP